MPIARDFSLDAKYRQQEGVVFLSGIQALVRLPLDQHRADRAARPQHRHADLRLPRLAARRPRPDARAQPDRCCAEHNVVFISGVNEDLGATVVYGSQLANLLPAAEVRRRARHVVRQGPGCRPHRRHLQARQLRRRRPERRCAGPRRRRPAVEVLDAARPTPRSPSTTRSVPRALPGQRPGDPRPRPPGLRAVALLRPLGRLQDRHQRRRRDRHRRGRAGPRERSSIPASLRRARPWRHTPEPDAAAALRPRDGARDPLRPPGGGARPSPPRNGLNRITARHARARGSASSPPARPTTTCARRSASSGCDDAALRQPRHPAPEDRHALPDGARHRPRVRARASKRCWSSRRSARSSSSSSATRSTTTPSTRASWASATSSRAVRWCRPTASSTPTASRQIVAARLERELQLDSVTARVALLEALRERPVGADAGAPAPSFCSGCPHNRSTVVPEGSMAAAGIGCHGMALNMPSGARSGITHMGGEGAQWVGHGAVHRRCRTCSRTSATARFFHSGSLADPPGAWPPAPTSPTRSSTTPRWR